VVVQFDCHPEASVLCAAKDLGEPREASRFLRRNNRAFCSLPYQAAPLPGIGDPEVQVERAAEGWVCLPQALKRVYRSAESAAPPKRRPSRNGGTRCGRIGWFTSIAALEALRHPNAGPSHPNSRPRKSGPTSLSPRRCCESN